jgi:hypothetical protein
MEIRLATEADWPAIWEIIRPIIREGETLAVDRNADEDGGRAYWMAPGKSVFVALDEAGETIGSYTLRANQTGPAGHVANAGYAVRGNQRAAFGRCSSILSSRPMSAPCGCGRIWALRSWGRCRGRFGIPCWAMSMLM